MFESGELKLELNVGTYLFRSSGMLDVLRLLFALLF